MGHIHKYKKTCLNCGHEYRSQGQNHIKVVKSCAKCCKQFPDSSIEELLNRFYFKEEEIENGKEDNSIRMDTIRTE